MPDSLMAWYERELGFLRSGAKTFAEEHPELAGHIGLGYDGVSDPHVSRMVESFALLNARLSRQLSEDSTKISNSLLQILFPLVLQPLPPASLIQIAPSKNQTSVATLPSGTRFRAYINEELSCQFHTTRDMQLCPFDILNYDIELRPFSFQHLHPSGESSGLIKLDISMLDSSARFCDLTDFGELTIHFLGLPRHQALMYDMLCRNCCSMVLMDNQGQQVHLSLDDFAPVGFVNRDCMITHENTIFLDQQMTMEVLSWPELFYGFRLLNFGKVLRRFSSSNLSLIFFIEDMTEEQLLLLKPVEFRLGCAPVINLFEQVAEPVVVDQRQLDYALIPDSHSPDIMEIQTVREVLDITGEQPRILPPLFGLKHNDVGQDKFWLYNPPKKESYEGGRLEIICPELDPESNQTMVLSPHLVCSNGRQVLDLPDNPKLECLDDYALPEAARMLMRPTPFIKRSPNIKNRLNLLVHLKAGFSAVVQGKNPARNLLTLMQLYCFNNNAFSRAWLDSMIMVHLIPRVAPIRIGNHQCFTQGIELILELDPSRLKTSGVMMFVNLIDFLVAGFAGYHSFLQLVIRMKGQSGDYVRCIRRHGYQINR